MSAIHKKIALVILLAVILILPTRALALVSSLAGLGDALLRAVWIVFTIIVVVCFVTSGILFLTAQGDPTKLKIARQAVIWGVAGIVVGILAYSIITVLGGALQ